MAAAAGAGVAPCIATGVATAGIVVVTVTAGVVTDVVTTGVATVAAAPAAALVDGATGAVALTVAGADVGVTSTACTGACAGGSEPAHPAKIMVVPSAVRVAVI